MYIYSYIFLIIKYQYLKIFLFKLLFIKYIRLKFKINFIYKFIKIINNIAKNLKNISLYKYI
jgi:hypothetical protein